MDVCRWQKTNKLISSWLASANSYGQFFSAMNMNEHGWIVRFGIIERRKSYQMLGFFQLGYLATEQSAYWNSGLQSDSPGRRMLMKKIAKLSVYVIPFQNVLDIAVSTAYNLNTMERNSSSGAFKCNKNKLNLKCFVHIFFCCRWFRVFIQLMRLQSIKIIWNSFIWRKG